MNYALKNMKTICIAGVFSIAALAAHAQSGENLLSNGGFESTDGKVKKLGAWFFCRCHRLHDLRFQLRLEIRHVTRNLAPSQTEKTVLVLPQSMARSMAAPFRRRLLPPVWRQGLERCAGSGCPRCRWSRTRLRGSQGRCGRGSARPVWRHGPLGSHP